MPETLMGLTEIAEYLGVSRQRVHQLTHSPGFPEPVARLSAGHIWTRVDVETWARDSGRAQSADSPQDSH